LRLSQALFFGVLPAIKGSQIAGKLSFSQNIEFLGKNLEFWCKKNTEF